MAFYVFWLRKEQGVTSFPDSLLVFFFLFPVLVFLDDVVTARAHG
jgi:hypothetical protein